MSCLTLTAVPPLHHCCQRCHIWLLCFPAVVQVDRSARPSSLEHNTPCASIQLPPFTLVGATTRAGLLTSPLRDRFGIIQRLEFYSVDELKLIVERASKILRTEIDNKGATEIARRSRGTPRIANRLLRRVRDYSEVMGDGNINEDLSCLALDMLNVDKNGFDQMDRRLLMTMIDKFEGGPVGVDSLAAAISEERDTIEDVLEPYLIQQGFIMRTPRGRVVTQFAYRHFDIEVSPKLKEILGGE